MDTKKLRQKILDLAIHGKLVPQDPNDEPASVLLERIKAEKERLIKEGKIKRSRKAKETTDTPHYENVPFEVPEGWVWKTLDSICVLIEDCCHSTAKNEGSGYPLIRTSNVGIGYLILDNVHRVSETIYKKRNVRATPQANDIIYAREAPAGNAALVKENEYVCLGQRTVLIRPMFVNPKWLTYIINSPTIRRLLINQATGSTVLHVNMESIRSLRLPIPSLTEQNRIVDKIEEIITIINTIELDTTNLKSAVEKIKFDVLSLAFHGKLVPQDPNDESASELLKRINPKAEITCDNGQNRKLPKSWCKCKIKDVFTIVMGQSPKGESINNHDGIEFHQGKLNFTEKWVSHSKILTNDPIKIVKPYSLLLCVRAPVGVVNITQREVCIGRGLCALENCRALDNDYAFYAVKTYKEIFESKSTGTIFKAISRNIIENEMFFLPPIAEQKRIVNKIEKAFVILDQIQNSLEA